MWTGLSTYLFCSCNHSNDRTHAELKTSSYSSGEGRSWHCVIARIDLLRNISAHLQRRCSSRSHLLHSSWTFLASSSSSAVISSPSSSLTFQSISKCVLSLQIHDSLSVFLPDFDSFFLPPHCDALSAWYSPQQSSSNSGGICGLPSPASSHRPLISLVSRPSFTLSCS